jgi:hypothetical protein
MKRTSAVGLAGAAVWLAACGTAPHTFYASHPRCADGPDDDEQHGRCFSTPEAQEYLEEVQGRILAGWELPKGVAPEQKVVLRFWLRPDGSFQCLSLSPGAEEDVAESVLSALERSLPLPPLPSGAACLGEVVVTAAFSNPLAAPR